MLFAGSDDGVYRFSGLGDTDESTPTKVLDSGRVRRVRSFEHRPGLAAATQTGLFYSADGVEWTDLEVPEERVYSVGESPSGDALYAGTRPAHVYVTRSDPTEAGDSDGPEWQRLTGFDRLPSREEWRLPRHENLAQVRDVCTHQAEPDRVVAGVEVGGVHVSDDGGETWTERREGVDDDVHELCVLEPSEFVVATGFGLFHTTDAGLNWTRLDEDVPQRYFRAVAAVDGAFYAASAMANSSTWEDDDANPVLYRFADGTAISPVDVPYPDETITGMTAVDGDLVAATHRGHVIAERPDGWAAVGEFPKRGQLTGTYTPLCRVEP